MPCPLGCQFRRLQWAVLISSWSRRFGGDTGAGRAAGLSQAGTHPRPPQAPNPSWALKARMTVESHRQGCVKKGAPFYNVAARQGGFLGEARPRRYDPGEGREGFPGRRSRTKPSSLTTCQRAGRRHPPSTGSLRGQGAAGTGLRGSPAAASTEEAVQTVSPGWGQMPPTPTVSAILFHNQPGFHPSQGKSIKTQYILIISLRATSTIVSRWGPQQWLLCSRPGVGGRRGGTGWAPSG